MKNRCLEVTLQELERAGIRCSVERVRSGHYHVRWQHNGVTRQCVVPHSPSDQRGWLNTRAFVRRQLRADGVTP